MTRFQTKGIVLKRVNYGEADRILTFFTEDRGKVSAIARGVRKPKSKLAGGIELFSICNIGLVRGRSDLNTLTSTRLEKHFEALVKDYDRLQIAYDMVRFTDKLTDDDAGPEYYDLLVNGLQLLEDAQVSGSVAGCWFYMQILKLNGSLPNLLQDVQGSELKEDQSYGFSTEDGNFFVSELGNFGATEIKSWRVFLSARPNQLQGISGLDEPAGKSFKVLQGFVEFQI